ncbi:hypothetical protein [Mesorhizobium sp. WSM4313]|uniref:hypothetical protein n=1 Tax=Mesorhizobium sp. WSM4313 TaxID=2029412 RepID=UPI000BB060F0|nr:hypothetical protein [Mesorhizobium sp. WSM4313]PBB18934.1 hypothetical protein CK219_16580 [Mesorhizobium sp. WSM4313]
MSAAINAVSFALPSKEHVEDVAGAVQRTVVEGDLMVRSAAKAGDAIDNSSGRIRRSGIREIRLRSLRPPWLNRRVKLAEHWVVGQFEIAHFDEAFQRL